ncbi:MAG: carboxypeptidase-like regulatory domain-containing protein [Acidobacteriota bacterium]|nr:carboxypeptidase-like regulatory domain-containing protein [Acidobacteriota bacterium]
MTRVVSLLLILAAAAPAAAGGAARGRLRGAVRSAEGRALPAAAVIAQRTAGPAFLGLTVTDGRGLYALDGLPPGPYRVLALAEGFQPARLEGIVVGGPFRAVARTDPPPGIRRAGFRRSGRSGTGACLAAASRGRAGGSPGRRSPDPRTRGATGQPGPAGDR